MCVVISRDMGATMDTVSKQDVLLLAKVIILESFRDASYR